MKIALIHGLESRMFGLIHLYFAKKLILEKVMKMKDSLPGFVLSQYALVLDVL